MEIITVSALNKDINAIIMSDAGEKLFDKSEVLKPVDIGSDSKKISVSPWGATNNLPSEIRTKIEASDIMATNMAFNRDVCYGLGPKLVKVIRDKSGKVVDFVEVEEGKEFDFFLRNDIPMYYYEQCTDMVYFNSAFPELIPEKSSGIFSIKHKEAEFSRWSVMNKKGSIDFHYYSSIWNPAPSIDDVSVSRVIDEFNPIIDIEAKLALNKKRMIFPVYMPGPGRPYYPRPNFYSLFESGWYDHSVAIPALKKAIMKNNLGVKFIVYISPRYWEEVLRAAKVDKSDAAKVKEVKDKETAFMNDFLAGAENAGKGILSIKELLPVGNTAIEHKWIEVIPIKNEITGGEYLSDVETVANIMSYATGVNPSLIGAVPGKNGSSIGGTDKRELFLIKQALMKPLIDRVLRPLQIIKKINKWDNDITIIVPEYVFTTLDQNKSGKQESTTNKM